MNTYAGLGFSIRANLKLRPFMVLTMSAILTMFIFGLSNYLFEYYNSTMISLLSTTGRNANIVSVMQKFSNVFNSFWVIIATMTTVGYGDLFPTTYFGRVISTAACILGTFVLSLLIVFLNNQISFDELEKRVYETVMEESFNPLRLKKEGLNLISNVLKYSYLRNKNNPDSGFYRLFLLIEMKYSANSFKNIRISTRRTDIDIDKILRNIRTNFQTGIVPFKTALDNFNKLKMMDDNTMYNLKDSRDLSEKLSKNSIQMWNLLNVLNKGEKLEGLKKIEDVYSYRANIVDEIIQHHDQEKFVEKIVYADDNSYDESYDSSNKSQPTNEDQNSEDMNVIETEQTLQIQLNNLMMSKNNN
jgi:hypothetical protein